MSNFLAENIDKSKVIKVKGLDVVLDRTVDSGAQFSVVRADLLKDIESTGEGKINVNARQVIDDVDQLDEIKNSIVCEVQTFEEGSCPDIEVSTDVGNIENEVRSNLSTQLTQAFQDPHLLFAYREIPHELTGVSPYQLVYGRVPSRPKTILKEFWTEEREIPTSAARSVDYLKQLQKKSQDALEITSENSAKNQEHKETQPNIDIELNQMPDVLNAQQKYQLRILLQRYEDIFRNRTGKAKVKDHSVKVTADNSSKRFQPYRVPIALQKEVERQVNELLHMD
ncbi:pro-Pol polyprotein [Trichonephila clavipes]|nr:pro-Pol polyprotein [Trichonephila clavipes]